MLLTIRHLPQDLFREMSCTFDEQKRSEIATDALKHNQYIRVAELELNETYDKDIHGSPLLVAFEATNSIDSPWYFQDIATEQASKGCRSTSVGDIVQLQGKSYMVANCGFLEITKG